VGGMRVPDRDVLRTARRRLARRRLAENLAEQQAGVLSRPQAYAAGITRWEVRANVAARRWRAFGKQSLVTYTGPLTDRSREWAAVFEAGPRGFLDGASSLKADGLKNFDVDKIRVSVPRGARVRRAKGIDIRQTRRWAPDDLAPGPGVPRSRSDVAAVRGALWAMSNKQAALLLAMTVQQGLATPQQLGEQMLRIRRDRRRQFLNAVVLDLLGGVRSLSELEVARECRRRGLPEPTRQVVRRGKNGTYYLDLVWEEWGLVVEVDGIHHSWAQNVVSDALRQNDVTLQNARVLRMPILGLRVAADDFFGQIEDALVTAGCPIGWSRPA
jgi:very-short-patch-repair endonuclease